MSNNSIFLFNLIHCFPFVTPGLFPVFVQAFPTRLLIKVDFPTFGIPGEKVQIKNGRIYVNGKKTKAYSSQKILSAGLASEEITLKSEQYFVVGDNYNNSEDSRSASVGNIKRSNIVGKVGIKYWQ